MQPYCQKYSNPLTSGVLKKPHAARYGVEHQLKMRGAEGVNWRVHSAYGQDVLMSRSPWMGVSDEFLILALSRARLRLFQHTASMQKP